MEKENKRILEGIRNGVRMLKIMFVFGTRPEAIKMAPLILEALKQKDKFEVKVVVTGQHREMLNEVLEIFKIIPDYDLKIMKKDQTIIDISVSVLKEMDKIIKIENPNIIFVHGDTSTALNTAMAAFYNQIEIAHVEAGLRSYDMYSPFPEEMNRKLISSLATYHFAPTEGNKQNLLKENIKENVFVTGNTVIDALFSVIKEKYIFEDKILNDIDFEKKEVILLTCHRRENLGKRMKNIFEALLKIVNENKNIEVIFPMHKNPKVRKIANEIMGKNNQIHLIEPLKYVSFVNLMKKVKLILTDSGGIQEEAPALGKPVFVLRTETERPEALEAGTIKLIGVEKNKITKEIEEILKNNEQYNLMSQAKNPYGDGNSSKKILKIINEILEKGR